MPETEIKIKIIIEVIFSEKPVLEPSFIYLIYSPFPHPPPPPLFLGGGGGGGAVSSSLRGLWDDEEG